MYHFIYLLTCQRLNRLHPQPTRMDSWLKPYVNAVHNLTVHICDRSGHNVVGQQQDITATTVATGRHKQLENTDIQVKVWQSFYSLSIALCNAPFNAPCSPVTPLLLVIAWYCTVLPCAPSCLQPQSQHTAQQAIVVYTETSVRG